MALDFDCDFEIDEVSGQLGLRLPTCSIYLRNYKTCMRRNLAARSLGHQFYTRTTRNALVVFSGPTQTPTQTFEFLPLQFWEDDFDIQMSHVYEIAPHLFYRDCNVPALLNEASFFGLSGLEAALQVMQHNYATYQTKSNSCPAFYHIAGACKGGGRKGC